MVDHNNNSTSNVYGALPSITPDQPPDRRTLPEVKPQEFFTMRAAESVLVEAAVSSQS